MKANKAPEKIYIQSFNVNEEDAKFDKSKMFLDDIWTEEPESGEENIEYTRTDAFIEKAVNYLKCNLSGVVAIKKGNITQGLLRTTSEFIEEFKKFMKGE